MATVKRAAGNDGVTTPKFATRLMAIAAAGLASAALAGAALASSSSSLAPYNGPGNEYQFGTGCTAGKALTVGGTINWHENTSAGTIAPEVDGNLCLQKTKDTYRIALVYYVSPTNHTEIGRYYGGKTVGNGSSLQTTAVAKQGPRVDSSAMDHVHVVIQKYDSSTSTWVDDTSNVIYATY
jgi:hypothetical protein